MAPLKPIRSEAEYDRALADVEAFFDQPPAIGSAEADQFEMLLGLIAQYEAQNWPISSPDPVAAIEQTMALRGFKQSDLATLLGSRSRASEILGRHRRITMEHAYRLNRDWGIPAEILVQPYALHQKA